MIEVGVRQEDEVDPVGRDRERVPVPSEELPLLVKAAIDKNGGPACLDGVTRTRDLTGRAEEPQPHGGQAFLSIQSSQLPRRGKYMKTRTTETASRA